MHSLIKDNILIDTHCHLNSNVFDEDREDVLKRAADKGVGEIWDISTDIQTSKKSIQLAEKYPNLKSFVGVDPEVFVPGSEMFIGFDQVDQQLEDFDKELSNLISQFPNLIVGIGETGMDFHWIQNSSEDERNQSKESQEKLFRMHLELAQKHSLPLSIHSRAAERECLEIVKEYEVEVIFHSFAGDYETAKEILASGYALGVNGISTFKNAEGLRDVYKKLLAGKKLVEPIDFYEAGIFFETDSPYLSPQSSRGERNEPGNVLEVFESFKDILAI